MVSLGLMLETGDHAPKDLKAAYALYEKAAERGSADGAIDLAVALVSGKGIEVNKPRAVALLDKASESGSPRATYDLAALVSSGVGGRPSNAVDSSGAPATTAIRKAIAPPPSCSTKAAASQRIPPPPPRTSCARSPATGDSKAELTAKAQSWLVATIKELQTRLKSAGYYAGPIDGRSGPSLGPALTQWRLLGPPQKS